MFLIGIHRGTFRREQVSVVRRYDRVGPEIQRADECGLQLGKEMQRSAQERDVSADRLTAGQTADRLVYDRLENGGGEVFLRRAFIDQRLDIRLREHAAASGDGIDGLVVFGILIQAGSVRLQKRGHLIDERAGTAGADTVHALVDAAGKVNDLRVLAAELDRNVGLRCVILQCSGDRHDFLEERNVQMCGDRETAGSRNDRGEDHVVADQALRVMDQFGERLLNVGKMPPVVGKDDFSVRIQNHDLNGRGSDIDTQSVDLVLHRQFISL